MIYIHVETKRVYSHGTDGMAKIETIVQKFEDGRNWQTFLKYLPYQGYLKGGVKVINVINIKGEVIEQLNVKEWQNQLNEVLLTLDVTPLSVEEKYEAEKKRNDELMERMASLEAKLGLAVRPNEIELAEKKMTEPVNYSGWSLENLRIEFERVAGKAPNMLWKEPKLIEQIEKVIYKS